MQSKTSQQLGFGLAEVLLASGVLILVVSSIVALSRFVIRGYALTASRTQALYFAQEGLERVRNIRDTLWIDEDTTTDFSLLANGDYCTKWNSAGYWELKAAAGDCPVPETIASVGQTALPVTFSRYITVESPSTFGNSELNDNTKEITVRVQWVEGGRTWEVRAATYLTNWKTES